MSNRPKIVVDNPDTLAPLIRDMGGTIVPGPTFQFEIPLADVAAIVPKIHALGVSVKKISEQLDRNPFKARYEPQTIAKLALTYRDED